MALIKLGAFITQLSGKIGGQTISNRGSQTTIRNIVHTNKTPTFKQSVQRYQTARIVNRYLFLSEIQKTAWATASADYEYVNRVGDTLTRTAFGTFCFINQNLNLIGQAIRNSPPLYVPAVSPTITIDNYGSSSLVISSSDADSIYTYGLYAVANLSAGATGQRGKMRFCGNISESDLTSGIDIIPQIENVFGALSMPNNIGFFISAINTDTGNRTQNETIYTQEVIAGTPIVFDPDYQALLDDAILNGDSTPTESQQILQNQLMLDIKAVLPLSAFDWLYVLASDSGRAFTWYNWADVSKFKQSGTWRYQSNLGSSPTGVGGSPFTSNYTPSTDAVAYTLNDGHVAFKKGSNVGNMTGNDSVFGMGFTGQRITQNNNSNNDVRMNNTTVVGLASSGVAGFFNDINAYSIVNRLDASNLELIRNGVSYGSVASASVALPVQAVIFGNASASFSDLFTVLHCGRALTLTEAQGLNTAFNNYLASI